MRRVDWTRLLIPSEETVTLGPLPVGTYNCGVRQHDLEVCDPFVVNGIFRIVQAGCDGSSYTCPLVVPSYTIIDLGTLGGMSSTAIAVNNRGEVVGSADTAQGVRHAIRWKDGRMIDLSTLGSPGAQSESQDINDQGVIVRIVGGGSPNAAFIWEDGVQTLIGPPEVQKGASGISEAHQVEGELIVPGGGNQHAFLWENGTTIDLETLGGTIVARDAPMKRDRR